MDPDDNTSRNARRLEGRYANHFAIGYNAVEFIFDFGQSYFENGEAELYTRIVTSPLYAKAFLKTLVDSIDTFESTYGSISDKALRKPDH